MLVLFSFARLATGATVTVSTTLEAGTSQLRLGITHTHIYWEKGNTSAVARVKSLLQPVLAPGIQNQSIMGWGAGPVLQASAGAAFNFSGIDARVNLMRSLGGEMALTLCTAPGWMKTSGQDWNMNDRVADNHVTDFANLCKAIAQRYPEVRYFVVWNEMKGYWNGSIHNSDGSWGNWDYVRYTALYNAVYRAIKSVRPDAEVGGFYLPVDGDASNTRGYSGTGTQAPVISRDMECLNYWLAQKAGADFIAVDRWLADYSNPNILSEADQLALTWTYQTVLQAIRAKTSLPIWYSEYHTATYNTGGSQFVACAEASTYCRMIQGAGSTPVTALLWNPSEGESGVAHYLFTSTTDSSGGQPVPHYLVFQWFHDYFPPGTQLYQAASSDPGIEVLACAEKTLLINKYSSSQPVTVNGKAYTMPGYGVWLIDTPSDAPPALKLDLNQLRLSWPGWATDYRAYSTTNLAPPVQWLQMTNTPQSSNGMLYLPFSTTNTREFFQLHSP